MQLMKLGGKDGIELSLQSSESMIATRTVSRGPIDRSLLSPSARSVLSEVRRYTEFAGEDITLWQSKGAELEYFKASLNEEDQIEFAGSVLTMGEDRTPIAYTSRIFLALHRDASPKLVHGLIGELPGDWYVENRLSYGRPCFYIKPVESIGQDVFGRALDLLERNEVDRCHPEFLREKAFRGVFDKQWHLGRRTIAGTLIDQSADVEAAWSISRGQGTSIAVIDDGIDTNHPEFSQRGKVVAEFDITDRVADARPKRPWNNHGTPCAGVACAAGIDGASGVAPDAQLIPIRNVSALGGRDESDSIDWAVRHGADVISCSWGPPDGDWEDPNDPRHFRSHPISDNTALSLEAAMEFGRQGRGCVICWAAGNGNESADLDGYVTFGGVMGVAACNDRGTRSVYSDIGNSIDCAFPSNNFSLRGLPDPLTDGIATTDRRGRRGYDKRPSPLGDYTTSFGGTSSACPGAAGAAALVISTDPLLTGQEVQQVLKDTADKIDRANGGYDTNGHSQLYGYGRLNVERALRSLQT
ncbi:MAG: S8 family serine peptidase [Erythrobacter sp.]|nr:S8 family serine peptidase [Erythrobacter sp.]